ncbi:MAG: molybdopterin-containing oxidoreductase family protein [Acidimicrobiales bacterium]
MSEKSRSELPISGSTEQVRVTCTHDCPDACSAIVTVKQGRAVAIGADDRHPVTGRHLCSKVDRYLERVYDPNRLETPLRRVGPKGTAQFEPISWAEAIDEIVSRWQNIAAESGPEAILPFSYLGNMGALSAFGPTYALFNHLGASKLHRAICGGQAIAINGAMGAVQADPEEVVNAELIICWGIDVVSTSIHMWDLIRTARRNGARLIVIDPYRSATAKRADVHLAINPGTDGALALAIANTLITEDLVDHQYVSEHTSGFDALAAEVAPWTAEKAAEVTGLTADEITELARAYAAAKPATIRFGVGMQRAAGAGMAVRAIQCLPALAGHWRHRGGGIVNARTMPMLGFDKMWGTATDEGRDSEKSDNSRTFNMIQLGQALTDTTLAPPVRSLFVWNSNPAIISGDQNRIIEGLERDDLFTVVHDLFITDTARYADIVLPAPSMIEHDDLVGSWGFNYIAINRAAIEPLGEAKSNSEVARLLAAGLGFDDAIFTMSDDQLIRHCLDGSGAEAAGADYQRLDAEGFVRVPHPGGEVPFADGGFSGSDDGRFEFSSSRFDEAFGLGSLPRFIEQAESPETQPELAKRFPLRLLTLKRPHSINSSYGDLPVLRGAEPQLLIEIHPEDALSRGLVDGQSVAAKNDRGRVVGTASVTDAVTAGVVVVPFGRWLDGGEGANALTSDRLGDLGGGPTFCDVLVEIEPA